MAGIAIIGASGRAGEALARRLLAQRYGVIAIGRSEARYRELGLRAPFRRVDLSAPDSLAAALADAEAVAVCVHARFLTSILPALPPRLVRIVALGSTRKFTRFPDKAALAVREAEFVFEAAHLPGVMLHPTMIYGARAESNIQRVAAYIRRFGIVPLPGGGQSLVQPIHVDDVAACLEAALVRPTAPGASIVIAGPQAMEYRDMVRAVGRAIGREARILSVPAPLLKTAALLTPVIPGAPRVWPAEVRRLLEDKAFDIAEMQTRLGIVPMDFQTGLARTFRDQGGSRSS